MQQAADSASSLVISYLTLRRVIGLLGLLLPFILAIGAIVIFGTGKLEPSISDYYYTGMRDVFVGVLFAVAFVLLSYRGYKKRAGEFLSDNAAANLAWASAIGVALFPTKPTCGIATISAIFDCAHGFFTAVFFLTLAYFALVLFTKTDPSKTPTPRKRARNKVYRACGWIILACIVLIFLLHVLRIVDDLAVYNPVFWLEAIAVVTFGFCWLVKGEAILADL